MSTNNYYFDNMCVVVHDETEYYCEKCEIYQYNDDVCEKCEGEMHDNHIEDFYDDNIENWKYELVNKVKGMQLDESGSYARNEALILASIDMYKANGEYYATIHATYRSGYYVGACLDYTVEYDDYVEATKTDEKKIQSKCNALARVLRGFGKEIVKVGQFSNGEAVYKLA